MKIVLSVFEKYKSNDKIISCDLENMKKHNYHEKCFNKCIKYNKYFTACPFCMNQCSMRILFI